MARANPLLAPSTLPNQAPAFDKIQEKDYLPAFKAALKEARANIRALKKNPEQPTFDNTVVALETADEKLSVIAGILSNQMAASSTPTLTEIQKTVETLTTKFNTAVFMDKGIIKRVKQVWEKHHADTALTSEQKTLLNKQYDGIRRSGGLLKGPARERMKKINEESATLGTDFSENIKKSMQAYRLVVTDEARLKGLPDDAIQAAAERAKEKGVEGYVFTLDYPCYIPFMDYADDRSLREEVWRAFNTRAWKDEFDNQGLLRKIVELEHESASLLGYKNTAEFIVEDRMSETVENVNGFLKKLLDTYKPAAEKELAELQEFATANGGPEKLMPWDIPYYIVKMKEEKFGFSDEQLKPYLPLDRVLNGCFEHFSKKYGIKFNENNAYPVYADDVKAFDVSDEETGAYIGTFYTDFHPRKGKNPGAWMTLYRNQGLYQGTVQRPITAIVCNFPKPLADKPSLLSHDDVETLFHEMGHNLHGLLSDVTYKSLASPNVKWDTVELPSQVEENWTFTKETMDMISGHWQTGEKVPDDLIDKMNAAKNFMAGHYGLRQVNMGILDMTWYTTDPKEIDSKYGFDVFKFEEDATKGSRLAPMLAGPVSTAFSHIFAGGYAAGYHSYKWAQVLDADAYAYLTEREGYDTERLSAFRKEFLAKGGSEHPAVLYRNFRGRDADPDALLRREGLLAPKVA